MKRDQILVDSNIIVYAINRSSPKHLAAQEFLQGNIGKLVLAHQNILESLRVLTHKKFVNPMTPSDASVAVANISDACRIITPDRTAYHLTIQLITKYGLPGNLVFDAYLAATALANNVAVLATDNVKDFALIEEIKIINPFR